MGKTKNDTETSGEKNEDQSTSKTHEYVAGAFDWFLKKRIQNITKEDLNELYEKYFKSFDGGKGGFWDKLDNQLKNVEPKIKQAFAEIMWLQYLPVSGKPKNKDGKYGENKINTINTNLKLDQGQKLPYYNCDGCAGYGMAQLRLDADLADLILMFYTLTQENDELSEQATKEQFKVHIINWCLDIENIRSDAYNKDKKRKNPEKLLPIHNMLLYMCKPNQYESICSSSDKERIVKTFEGLLEDNKKSTNDEANIIIDDNNSLNKKIYLIKKKLKDWDKNFAFYEPEYRSLWNVEDTQSDALKFKKALILYGPPGTSKTYTSTKLAKNLIYQLNYQTNKKKAEKKSNPSIQQYFEDLKSGEIKKHIHRLQLHPNYTYEDFIWGYQIENEKYYSCVNSKRGKQIQCVGSKTTPKKGYFLRLLDEIQKDGKAHVLILDEINRVDLSRLFGELFSAIENRNEPVDLPVKIDGLTSTIVNGLEVSQISVPENLYIIGTMNEIDFSLERVDFALRRRFLWDFYGFNDKALYDILNEKQTKYNITKLENESIIDYYNRCKALNDAINADEDLGKQYEIGHTFFGEIIDLWVSLGTSKQLKTIQKKLWEISIGPMIEAYLGNCDTKTKEEKLKKFQLAFIPEKDDK